MADPVLHYTLVRTIEMAKSYYSRHVFFCQNQREDGQPCCGDYHAEQVRFEVKERLKSMGLHGKGQIRVNAAGCLGRCAEGPVLVVYPEGVWYSYVDREDIDEIVEQHLLGGKPVERLRLPDE